MDGTVADDLQTMTSVQYRAGSNTRALYTIGEYESERSRPNVDLAEDDLLLVDQAE